MLIDGTKLELHNKAMQFAQDAMVEESLGNISESRKLFTQAFEYELQVLNQLKEEDNLTRSIIYRSAASLAFDAQDYLSALSIAREASSIRLSKEFADDFSELEIRCNTQLNKIGLIEHTHEYVDYFPRDPSMVKNFWFSKHREVNISELGPFLEEVRIAFSNNNSPVIISGRDRQSRLHIGLSALFYHKYYNWRPLFIDIKKFSKSIDSFPGKKGNYFLKFFDSFSFLFIDELQNCKPDGKNLDFLLLIISLFSSNGKTVIITVDDLANADLITSLGSEKSYFYHAVNLPKDLNKELALDAARNFLSELKELDAALYDAILNELGESSYSNAEGFQKKLFQTVAAVLRNRPNINERTLNFLTAFMSHLRSE